MTVSYDRQFLEAARFADREADVMDRELREFTIDGVAVQAFSLAGAEYLAALRRGGGKVCGASGIFVAPQSKKG